MKRTGSTHNNKFLRITKREQLGSNQIQTQAHAYSEMIATCTAKPDRRAREREGESFLTSPHGDGGGRKAAAAAGGRRRRCDLGFGVRQVMWGGVETSGR
jgi:hypothetical protein